MASSSTQAKVSWWDSNKTTMAKRARIFRNYCLPLVSAHPSNRFKKRQYLPELAIHLPCQHQKNIDMTHSVYLKTVYLNDSEAEKYRIFIHEGKICYLDEQNQTHLFNTNTNSKNIFVLSWDGKIFSAPKTDNIQHTSFTRAGYLLCAGYLTVIEGEIKEVMAESGHHEPPPTSLQNFARFLKWSGCEIDNTRWLFVDRVVISDEKQLQRTAINISDKILENALIEAPSKHNPLSIITPDVALITPSFFESIKANATLSRGEVSLTAETKQNWLVLTSQ